MKKQIPPYLWEHLPVCPASRYPNAMLEKTRRCTCGTDAAREQWIKENENEATPITPELEAQMRADMAKRFPEPTSLDAPVEGKTYHIVISDYQRKMFESALKTCMRDLGALLLGSPGEHRANAYEEASVLADMLADLPKDEDATPGATHGFAL